MGEYITIPLPDGDGRGLRAYLALPEHLPAPGMLVLHEAYGLNDNIRGVTDRFAREGYVALAVDLMSDGNRMLCMFRAFYGLLASPLNNSTVTKVRAAFDYLMALEGVQTGKVGAIGFCMGGSYALQLACLDGKVRAISVVSGQNPRPEEAMARACPVVGSYPERDITTASGKKLDLLLDGYNIPHDIKIYPDGVHSMFNESVSGYNPDVAADAWQRTLTFFDQHIRAG